MGQRKRGCFSRGAVMSIRTVTSTGASSGPAGFTDGFSINIVHADTNSAQTDNAAFAISLAVSESNADFTETMSLGISGSSFNDTTSTPTDAPQFTVRFWLSGGTATANGVSNVANSNGQNDAAVATIQSAPAGTNAPSITSALGSNIGTVTVASAIYRGWFRSVNTASTSTGTITMRSTSALFADKVMFSNSALNTTVDRLDGAFTYDLVANGIDTLAKIQSMQVIHATSDLIAGTTPHVLTVDAGCAEISGAFT